MAEKKILKLGLFLETILMRFILGKNYIGEKQLLH